MPSPAQKARHDSARAAVAECIERRTAAIREAARTHREAMAAYRAAPDNFQTVALCVEHVEAECRLSDIIAELDALRIEVREAAAPFIAQLEEFKP